MIILILVKTILKIIINNYNLLNFITNNYNFLFIIKFYFFIIKYID